jgi:hypothetical protein
MVTKDQTLEMEKTIPLNLQSRIPNIAHAHSLDWQLTLYPNALAGW